MLRCVGKCVCVSLSLALSLARALSLCERESVSMAPAAPPGKRRCWVSEGVGCLKVQRERGPGFPRPREAKNFEAFFSCSLPYTGPRAPRLVLPVVLIDLRSPVDCHLFFLLLLSSISEYENKRENFLSSSEDICMYVCECVCVCVCV